MDRKRAEYCGAYAKQMTAGRLAYEGFSAVIPQDTMWGQLTTTEQTAWAEAAQRVREEM